MIVQRLLLSAPIMRTAQSGLITITWVSKTCEKDGDYLIIISIMERTDKRNVKERGSLA